MNLRSQANKVAGIAHTLSGSAMFLTGPDGIRRQVHGIFTSDRINTSPDSGEEVEVVNPVASFSRSSLVVVPQNGENWALEAPLDVGKPDILTMFAMTLSKSVKGGRSLDTIILDTSQVEQSS